VAVEQPFPHHALRRRLARLHALLGVEVVAGVDAALPLEPLRARALGVEVGFDREPHVAREMLRARAHQQVVVGVVEHRLRDARRRPHALERRDAARALQRPVHAAGVELHDAVGVRQPAVADVHLGRVELDDVDARDQRLEHVLALRDPLPGLLDAAARPAVLVLVAVGG
jgi:hypothetical protein